MMVLFPLHQEMVALLRVQGLGGATRAAAGRSGRVGQEKLGRLWLTAWFHKLLYHVSYFAYLLTELNEAAVEKLQFIFSERTGSCTRLL